MTTEINVVFWDLEGSKTQRPLLAADNVSISALGSFCGITAGSFIRIRMEKKPGVPIIFVFLIKVDFTIEGFGLPFSPDFGQNYKNNNFINSFISNAELLLKKSFNANFVSGIHPRIPSNATLEINTGTDNAPPGYFSVTISSHPIEEKSGFSVLRHGVIPDGRKIAFVGDFKPRIFQDLDWTRFYPITMSSADVMNDKEFISPDKMEKIDIKSINAFTRSHTQYSNVERPTILEIKTPKMPKFSIISYKTSRNPFLHEYGLLASLSSPKTWTLDRNKLPYFVTYLPDSNAIKNNLIDRSSDWLRQFFDDEKINKNIEISARSTHVSHGMPISPKYNPGNPNQRGVLQNLEEGNDSNQNLTFYRSLEDTIVYRLPSENKVEIETVDIIKYITMKNVEVWNRRIISSYLERRVIKGNADLRDLIRVDGRFVRNLTPEILRELRDFVINKGKGPKKIASLACSILFSQKKPIVFRFEM